MLYAPSKSMPFSLRPCASAPRHCRRKIVVEKAPIVTKSCTSTRRTWAACTAPRLFRVRVRVRGEGEGEGEG